MENTINSQVIVTETKQYFSETIKYIYFNVLTPKQWGMYFNILKASLETNTPMQNILTFAEALDYARISLCFNSSEEQKNYNKMKDELKSIIKRLKDPKIVIDNKSLILKPNASLVQPTAKKHQ